MNTPPKVNNNVVTKKVVKLKRQDFHCNIVAEFNFTKGEYYVDSLGNFYSNGRKSKCKPGVRGDILVYLVDDEGTRTYFQIHRIVLQTFDPSGLKDGLSVDHINRIRTDNRLSNLRYANRKTQGNNKNKIGRGEKPVKCKTNGKKYKSCRQAEKDLGLVKGTVCRVARGERKAIHGYSFEYIKPPKK